MSRRSEALVKALVEEAKADPTRRVAWARFDGLGAALRLSKAAIEFTLGHCFDVFTWEVEDIPTGRVLVDADAGARLRAIIVDKDARAAETTQLYYKLK